MMSQVDEEIDRFVEYFPKLKDAVREASAQHPSCGAVENLLNTFGEGYLTYLFTGSTPEQAYLSMRWLFCLTNGRFNNLMEHFVALVHPPYRLSNCANGALGNLDDCTMGEALRELRENGFWVFKERLPQEFCERLKSFASNTDCLLQPDSKQARYDPEHPASVTYHVPGPELLNNRDLQHLLSDPSKLALAEAYLGCEPVISHVGMWWSTAFSKEPDSSAAQLYHFDMDRLSFLQLFVYLTDVTSETGPHCFVKGSHRHKPLPLLRDGRFSDEEISDHYSPEAIVEITGPQGTMFAVDTRAFHKGKHLQSGDRLVFQTVYAVNLFGAPYDLVPLGADLDPRLSNAIREHPRTFSRFTSERL